VGGTQRGADPVADGLTIFLSVVGDEAFYVEVNFSNGYPSGNLSLGFESPPLEIALEVESIKR
jgi:hypothetical protein